MMENEPLAPPPTRPHATTPDSYSLHRGRGGRHHPRYIPHSATCEASRLLPSSPIGGLADTTAPPLSPRAPSCPSHFFATGVSGVVGFLLSSTLAVSCATVIAGTVSPLQHGLAALIDMHLLGTTLVSVVLVFASQAPYAVGAVDIFTVPIVSDMARVINDALRHTHPHAVVPTVLVTVSLCAILLGLATFCMGRLRLTSVVHYVPFPVIAGFLSGLGGVLVKNAVFLALPPPPRALSWSSLAMLLPPLALAFALRWIQSMPSFLALAFASVLVGSTAVFHVAVYWTGTSLEALQRDRWLFCWDDQMLDGTAFWLAWRHISLAQVHWAALLRLTWAHVLTLLVLGSLKYSIKVGTLSAMYAPPFPPDREIQVLGLANILSGLAGCSGGCHLLTAVHLLESFDGTPRAASLVRLGFLVGLWAVGLRSLLLVPTFIFSGLLLHLGANFLEHHLWPPMLTPIDHGITLVIFATFVAVGMLESVALGVSICVVDLLLRLHTFGCIHDDGCGDRVRSVVVRSPDQDACLTAHGSCVYILRLRGYLFFATARAITTRIDAMHPQCQFVLLDFSLVVQVDASALMALATVVEEATRRRVEVLFCGLAAKPWLEMRLRELPPSSFLYFVYNDLDHALEACEDRLLRRHSLLPALHSPRKWASRNAYDLWVSFLLLQHGDCDHLIPVAVCLDKVSLPPTSCLTELRPNIVYFVCAGELHIYGNVGKVLCPLPPSLAIPPSRIVNSTDLAIYSPPRTAFALADEPTRVSQLGPGAMLIDATLPPDQTFSTTSGCILLCLLPAVAEQLRANAPSLYLQLLLFQQKKLLERCHLANTRVLQLSARLSPKTDDTPNVSLSVAST
ncbi:Aste57867_9796 [Aphanomyces stellatus]|uniref:Aste57867_9796 protein n=1 Tax=Aphanomyces stellatus TaxID=120398 RepID=A0A485KPF8_9STRA|nr:hypothetical protein As57867_009757 [Aphanomyces stellatus]VFT86675.1 Aste57867_9796 [Aphanomyces stellatus]